jgi:hypothetical protein
MRKRKQLLERQRKKRKYEGGSKSIEVDKISMRSNNKVQTRE